MGLLDWFRPKSAEWTPEQVRDALIDSVRRGDTTSMVAMCQVHGDLIREHAASWRKVPDAIRADPAAVHLYGTTLAQLAQCFAQVLDDRSIMKALGLFDAPDPVWSSAIAKAREHQHEGRYDQAVTALDTLVTEDLVGRNRAVTLGMLGAARFHGGHAAAAVAPLIEAIDTCERIGDTGGVLAWADGLFEVHRYLGAPEDAARAAETGAGAATILGQHEQSELRLTRAERVRAGEPLLRVIALRDGAELELDELTPEECAGVELALARNRVTLDGARQLVREAGKRIAKGAWTKALPLLDQASAVDPLSPDPHYVAATALLLLGKAKEAAHHLDQVEALAPGWFHARTHRFLADEMAEGRITAKTFRALHHANDPEVTLEERLTGLRRAIRKHPSAPIAVAQGELLLRAGKKERAIIAFEHALDIATEDASRTRALSALGAALGTPHGTAKLEQALALGTNPVAAATASLVLRRTPVS